MIDVEARLAAAALRGVLAEVEADPALAGPVLARLLVAPAPVVTATMSGPQRPAVVAAPPVKSKKKRRPRAAPVEGPPAADEPTEGARLVAQLVERCGSARAAGSQYGFSHELLGRWGRGGPCSPQSIQRLKDALASPSVEQARESAAAGRSVRPRSTGAAAEPEAGDDEAA